jgi:hypothetical protein
MPYSGILGIAGLVRNNVSGEGITFITKLTRLGELGTTLAVTVLKEPHSVTSEQKAFLRV